MNEQLLVAILFVVGALSRVVLPYLQVWLDSSDPFDWRMIIGLIIGSAIAIIPMVDVIASSLAGASLTVAIIVGWGAADIGREGQKFFDLYRKKS